MMRFPLAIPRTAVFGPAPVSQTIGYRADIDGLRAVAVTAVILFHAKLPLSGGFVGVDIFFVVSGYLITSMIYTDIRAGRFSILQFYKRRICRLFPALFAMLVVSMLAAAILFVPNDFERFGSNAAGTAAFVSNILFWEQGSYFQTAAANPLLHTWSLSIEEQFYLIFPPILILLHQRVGRLTITVVGFVMLTSLLASILVLPTHPSAAFYLPQFRIWELLCGSLLALGVVPRTRSYWLRESAGLSGMALIVFAIVSYSDTMQFPGAAALVPCLGAVLVIYAGVDNRSVVGHVLASRPLVFVGLISYSAYIWHWPLIVFFTYYIIDDPNSAESLMLVVTSFLIGILSYRFIELPFRRLPMNSSTSRISIFPIAAIASLTAATLGVVVYVAHGFPERFSTNVDVIGDYAMSQNPRSDRCGATSLQLARNSVCTIGDPARASIFLWGDSHAGALYGALHEIANSGPSTVYGATPRCPPLLGVGTDVDCIAGNQQRLAYVLAHPEIKTVILAARWSLYSRGRATNYGPAENNVELPELRDASGNRYPQFTEEASRGLRRGLYTLVGRLLAGDKHVVLVYPVPEMGYDIPSTIARLTAEGRQPAVFGLPKPRYLRRQRYLIPLLDGLSPHPNLMRLYPDRTLCPSSLCLGYKAGTPLYFDSHHLSIPGSQLLVPAIKQALQRSTLSAVTSDRITPHPQIH